MLMDMKDTHEELDTHDTWAPLSAANALVLTKLGLPAVLIPATPAPLPGCEVANSQETSTEATTSDQPGRDHAA